MWCTCFEVDVLSWITSCFLLSSFWEWSPFSVCLWGTAMHWFMVLISWLKHWLSISLPKQQRCPAELLPRITYRCMASDEKKPKRVKRNTVGICLLFAHIEPLLVDCFSMIVLFFWLTKSHHNLPKMCRCDVNAIIFSTCTFWWEMLHLKNCSLMLPCFFVNAHTVRRIWVKNYSELVDHLLNSS